MEKGLEPVDKSFYGAPLPFPISPFFFSSFFLKEREERIGVELEGENVFENIDGMLV